MRTKARYLSKDELKDNIQVAQGLKRAALVIKNAQYFDVFAAKFRTGDVAVHGGMIVGISESYDGDTTLDAKGQFLVPGFIDSHVHIESSLMTPRRFEEAVLPCGTTSVIWDPHEIANVKGSEGIAWALEASEGLQLDVFVMVPSCVPSTTPAMGLETSGAELGAAHLKPFQKHPRVLGLAEMMNFPGLLMGDDDVMDKLIDFNHMKRDGHCPGLLGKPLNAYGVAGIHSCHESTQLEEAREKLTKGVHVLIREGSCAKDADELLPLVDAYTSAVVGFCSDDRNPADIAAEGHINCIIDKALKKGHAAEEVFRAASFAPAKMYGLEDRGAIAPGYLADFVLVSQRDGKGWRGGMAITKVFKKGRLVDAKAFSGDAKKPTFTGKNMNMAECRLPELRVAATATGMETVRVIGVIPRKIITENITAELAVEGGQVLANPAKDVLKIAVFERHHRTGRHAVAFAKGFQIKTGAIATSINHDSHNVIVVGSSDEVMAAAVNKLREIDGGIVVTTTGGESTCLPLPIGGLMTDESPARVTEILLQLKAAAKKIGCTLEEPFLQLSFLALPVIPTLKITDRGLVDVTTFQLVPVSY